MALKRRHGSSTKSGAIALMGLGIFFALTLGSAPPASAEDPLKLVGSVPLPGFSCDLDHFAVDEAGNRLFLAGEDHKTVEVFDLKTGRRLKTLSWFGAPHSIFYLPESNQLVITDGAKGQLHILRGSDYAGIGHVDGLAGADSAHLDRASQTLYIAAGGKDVPLDYSLVVAIDLHTDKKVVELRIDSNHVEALALEDSSSRMFVNLTDKHEIDVIDRKTMTEIARWPIGSTADNSPMAYDEPHHRLLIVCRKPGTLLVMDSDTGKVVAHMAGPERSDDVALDPASGRVYVPGGDGRTFVFQQQSPDNYQLLAHVTTEPGAKNLPPGEEPLTIFPCCFAGRDQGYSKVVDV